MERLQNINFGRVAWCCSDYGITLDQLATEVGVSRASMERAASGSAGLTFNQLAKIAEFFGRGVLFFLDPNQVQVEAVHTVAFRTLANQKPELSAKLKALIARVEHQRDVYMELRDEIDADSLSAFEPPTLPQNDAVRAAALVRKWLGLSERNTFETYRSSIESKGILVFLSNGYNGKWQIAKDNPVMGFTLYDDECPVIVIKKQQWESQQTFTLIHELGHLLLQRMSSIDDDKDLHSHEGDERAANAFAGHLLVPETHLATIDSRDRPSQVEDFDTWLEGRRKLWGVSTEVILRRLLDSGRLTHAEYTAYRKWRANVIEQPRDGGNREWRHREPKHIFGDKFVRAVLEAKHLRYISLAKASKYLDGLKINDLHQLEKYYAGL
jgi:Zn-dependent peptidase ImmA (M78 family)/plasmid maintenance system antidote protein VapI